MLSIDEAINKHKNLKMFAEGTNDKRGAFYSAEEHEQIAEWLEELKELREKNETLKALYEDVKKEANNLLKCERNKAIDDFAEKLKSECREHYIDCDPYFGGITDSILYEDDIEEVVEQLKAGGENE